jgi:hypothetical protein
MTLLPERMRYPYIQDKVIFLFQGNRPGQFGVYLINNAGWKHLFVLPQTNQIPGLSGSYFLPFAAGQALSSLLGTVQSEKDS